MIDSRGGEYLRLIDLDASRTVGGRAGNDKLSTAYAPPEALRDAPASALAGTCQACQAPLPPPLHLWCNEPKEPSPPLTPGAWVPRSTTWWPTSPSLRVTCATTWRSALTRSTSRPGAQRSSRQGLMTSRQGPIGMAWAACWKCCCTRTQPSAAATLQSSWRTPFSRATSTMFPLLPQALRAWAGAARARHSHAAAQAASVLG